MPWKPGPPPSDTRGWGAAVVKGEEAAGFHFAEFYGRTVLLVGSGRALLPGEVAWYDDSIQAPPEPCAALRAR
jgi:hypothetical protein